MSSWINDAAFLTIGQVAILGVALIGYLQSRMNARLSRKNADAIQEIHLTINSRLTEFKAQADALLAASVAAAHAEGQQAERDRKAQ